MHQDTRGAEVGISEEDIRWDEWKSNGALEWDRNRIATIIIGWQHTGHKRPATHVLRILHQPGSASPFARAFFCVARGIEIHTLATAPEVGETRRADDAS